MDDIRNELGSIRSDMELRRANIAHYEERMERLLCDIEERERSASAQLLSLSELRSELSMMDGSDDDGSARALRDLLDEITAMKAELADALGMDEEELEARLSELSEGGKAIIAMPSRTKKGVSKISPVIMSGAGVVTTRAHAHWVVTEYGAVDLYGKSMQERAKLLTGIAHPDDREMLDRAAFERFGPHYRSLR